MKKIFASNTVGVQIMLMISLLISCFSIYQIGFDYTSLALIISGYFLYGCLGIVVTFHRYLTHRSYSMHPVLEKIMILLGCFGGTGSPLAWKAIHLNHHRHSDTERDTHSPIHRGIKIFGLDYTNNVDKKTKWLLKNMITDRFHQNIHRYYFLIVFSYSFALYIIGGIYLMVYLHLLPMLVVGIMSNVVNYVGHKPGWFGSYRSFDTKDQSVNNWVWAIPSWGESWHNNHHRYPKNYSFKQKWFEIDISGIIIDIIRKK